ncbi:MAG: adenine phosphoribosyltransferase [Elusimicrobiota bacterium]|nr:adenine phosphoribosyltransferase [Elusimicrobiota bacterium]
MDSIQNESDLDLYGLKKFIRDVKDFPKKGIIFRDITPLLKDKKAFAIAIDLLAKHYKNTKIDKIVSMESRGFIVGALLAYKLGVGFVPVRKKGKLPWKTATVSYKLEYGKDTLEIHKDGFSKGERILVVDDVLATGGTAEAVLRLVKKLGGVPVGLGVLIELTYLNPREKLKGYNVFSLMKY